MLYVEKYIWILLCRHWLEVYIPLVAMSYKDLEEELTDYDLNEEIQNGEVIEIEPYSLLGKIKYLQHEELELEEYNGITVDDVIRLVVDRCAANGYVEDLEEMEEILLLLVHETDF